MAKRDEDTGDFAKDRPTALEGTGDSYQGPRMARKRSGQSYGEPGTPQSLLMKLTAGIKAGPVLMVLTQGWAGDGCKCEDTEGRGSCQGTKGPKTLT